MSELKVLIPTDFSVQAEFAFIMVQKLAEQTSVDIHFLHVLEVPDTVTMNEQGKIETCGEIDVNYVKTQVEIAQRKLANLQTLYGSHIQVHLKLGRTTSTIQEFSSAHAFDLIVMGTKGVSGLREVIGGSETQMVARHSKVPVLSMMCDRSELQIQNVLLVHDFSENGNQNLDLLKKLIAMLHVKVHFLQVTSDLSENGVEKIEENMKVFARNNGIEEYQTHVIKDKGVEKGVIHFNQMSDMDIVCIGTHGKGGLFHHSAAEGLINHVYKPVISFQLI